jgi:hypothetical protein
MKFWMMVALAACGPKEPPAAGTGSTTPGSGSQPQLGEAAPPRPAVAKFPDLQPDHAVILADAPGGKVAFTLADNTTSELADGTIVEAHDEQFGESTVSSHGRTGTVALTHVIGSGAVHPAPSGVFAVLTPALGCGDYCHLAVWLVEGLNGRRWEISDNTVLPAVAWRADGKALAVDAGPGVAVIELPSGKQLEMFEDTHSPAYAPNGTLYLRGPDWEVFEVAGGKTKRVGQGVKLKLDYPMPAFPVKFDASGTWQLNDEEKPTKKK